MKKAVSLFLAIIMCLSLTLTAFAGTDDGTTAAAMSFRADGSFKILHVTDTHLSIGDDKLYKLDLALIKSFVTQNTPDLVVLTGDIAMDGTKEQVTQAIADLMGVLSCTGAKVAVTLGNHDTQNGYFTRSGMIQYYMSFPCCVDVDTCGKMGGYGSFNIPILASDGSGKVKFNLWIVDSGDYDGEGHYGYTSTEAINWYRQKSDELKAANGGVPVPSLMFQHIIVPEIYDALKETSKGTPYAVKREYSATDEYYILDPDNTNSGHMYEYPCPPYHNNGQFDAIVSQGDVLAMFFGHDHTNTFNVSYKGVDLVATPMAKFKDPSDTLKGARLITVNENDTSRYDSKLLTFASLSNNKTLSSLEAADSADNASVRSQARAVVPLYTIVFRIINDFAVKFVETFWRCRVEY